MSPAALASSELEDSRREIPAAWKRDGEGLDFCRQYEAAFSSSGLIGVFWPVDR